MTIKTMRFDFPQTASGKRRQKDGSAQHQRIELNVRRPTYAAAQFAADRIHRHLATHPVRAQFSAEHAATLPDSATLAALIDAAFWTRLRLHAASNAESCGSRCASNTGLTCQALRADANGGIMIVGGKR